MSGKNKLSDCSIDVGDKPKQVAEPKPCPFCKTEAHRFGSVYHCDNDNCSHDLMLPIADWNALPRDEENELADMPPCPVCGGRCAYAAIINGVICPTKERASDNDCIKYICINKCRQKNDKTYQTFAEWIALDRSKMPTKKKTAVVWVDQNNMVSICDIGTGKQATIDLSILKMSGDMVCRSGFVWLYADSIEDASNHIERVRLDKPTPERPQEPVADCKTEVDPLEDIKYSVCEKGKNVVSQALSFIDGDRQQQYGDYAANAQLIADAWSAMIGINVPVELVPAMFVAVKIIRMQRETDNEVDAMGYLIHQARMIVANNQNWPDVDDELDDDDGEKDKEDGNE